MMKRGRTHRRRIKIPSLPIPRRIRLHSRAARHMGLEKEREGKKGEEAEGE